MTCVSKHDSVRRVDVERLSFGLVRRTGRGVTNYREHQSLLAFTARHVRLTVANTHPALEAGYGGRVKDVANHTVRLDLVEPATRTASDETCCVLATRQLVSMGPSAVLEY